MLAYILRRLLLIIPTLFGIILINFTIVQFAPGGPVEQALAEFQGMNVDATAAFTGGGAEISTGPGAGQDSVYRGAQGVDPELIAQLEEQFGFDKPAHVRFFQMVGDYLRFDFGESYFRDRAVIDLILEKMPVSVSLGLWTTLIIYLLSIPLGIRKAVKDGTPFDVWTSGIVIAGYAIPSFLFAVLLIVMFAGGRYFELFPLRGLIGDGWQEWPWYDVVLSYFWHITLPVAAMVIGGFATLTLLTKNSFLDEIGKAYVQTARAKGIEEGEVLWGHVFRNAMLIVIAGFPAAFLSIFFTGSLLIEVIFSLDGLGLLGFEAVINRDYPVMFGTLYIFSLIGLLLRLVTDLTYVLVDPRIDFEARTT